MKSRSSNLDADQWEGGRVQFWELRFRSDHLPVILCRLLNLPVSFLESKASNSCLCHMQWSPCKCQGIFLIARVQHKNEKYICESILLCDGRTAQCVGWETDAQLLKFGGGLKKLIENCFKNSSLFLSNCFPGLTICGKCFSSVPLWNSQSNGLVTPLFIFLIMIFSYRFNCWPTYSFWFEGDKTCFLLYWINIYYIDSQVWASGFISKQKRTLFFFFFPSRLVLSQHFLTRLLALCASERKRWLWQNNAEPWPKKASEKHLDPPSQDGSAIFLCWVSYVSALKSLVDGRDIFKEVLKIICKGPRYTW